MSSGIPAILGALFGAPILQSTKVDGQSPPLNEGDKRGDGKDAASSPDSKAFSVLWTQIKGWIKNKDKLGITLVGTLVITAVLFFIVILVTLWYYLETQLRLYKDSKKSAEEKTLEAEIPYKDHIQYKILNPSVVFAEYKYRLLFYFTAIAFTLVILAFLIKKQMGMDSDAKGAGSLPSGGNGEDKDLLGTILLWMGIASLYLFAAFYWFVEKNYYNKINDLNSKITDFNQYVRSILPAHYEFLKMVSKDYDSATLDSVLYKPALKVIPAKRREIVRAICILNLYTYYFDNKQLYRNTPGGLSNVLGCFSPEQRILSSSQVCYSDYLINNKSYIPNKIGTYIKIIQETGSESAIYNVFNRDRTAILLEIDRVMSQLNERAGCLGSAYAYGLFLKMNSNIFLSVWVPLLIVSVVKGSKKLRESSK